MVDQSVVEFLAKGCPECPRCGHGLAGLRSSICPECGVQLRVQLATPGKRAVTIPASWVLWWNVAAGAVFLAYVARISWQMWTPVAEMARSQGQPPPHFAKFWLQMNLSLTGVFTGCSLVGLVGAATLLALMRAQPLNRRVAWWAVCFCGVSLAIGAALNVALFLD